MGTALAARGALHLSSHPTLFRQLGSVPIPSCLGPTTHKEHPLTIQGDFGLACNFQKCQMAPIHCDDEQIALAASLFPCHIVQFLIKYLGIPLLVTMLPRLALHPLLDRVADKLPVWKGRLMHRSGRLALIKSTLTTVLIYTLISMGLLA
jgi:hypothetical protein